MTQRYDGKMALRMSRAVLVTLCAMFLALLSSRQTDVLVPAGFEKVPVNLNEGGNNKGEKVWLMFHRDPTSSPITDLYIVEDQDPVMAGYRKIGEQLAHLELLFVATLLLKFFFLMVSHADVNLSKYGGGVPLYVAYRKDMPVLSVKLSTVGERGYEFIDKNLRPTLGRKAAVLGFPTAPAVLAAWSQAHSQ